MKVKFWGCRGSIPVCDKRMTRHGGNTTCVEIEIAGKILIIDAGTGIRMLGDDLAKRNIRDVDLFITHSHWDHIQGFPFFMPIFFPGTSIKIFGSSSSYKQLKDILSKQMSYEFFPISFSELKGGIEFHEVANNRRAFNGYDIEIIHNNHTAFATGIRVNENGKSFVFITDNELEAKNPITEWAAFADFAKGADYLIHDAQFTQEEYERRVGWGHSSFEQAIALARACGAANLGFFHHDPNRNDKDLDIIVRAHTKKLKAEGSKLKIFAVKEDQHIHIGG